jgi:hypothetical protein
MTRVDVCGRLCGHSHENGTTYGLGQLSFTLQQPHHREGPYPFPMGVCLQCSGDRPQPSRRSRVRDHTERRRCCESRRRLGPKGPSLCLIQLNDDRRCRLVLCGRSHRLYVELLAPHVRGIFVRA